jgi:hypothetical protein
VDHTHSFPPCLVHPYIFSVSLSFSHCIFHFLCRLSLFVSSISVCFFLCLGISLFISLSLFLLNSLCPFLSRERENDPSLSYSLFLVFDSLFLCLSVSFSVSLCLSVSLSLCLMSPCLFHCLCLSVSLSLSLSLLMRKYITNTQVEKFSLNKKSPPQGVLLP